MTVRAYWARWALVASITGSLVTGPLSAASASSSLSAGAGEIPSGPAVLERAVPVDQGQAMPVPPATRELLVAFDTKTTSVTGMTNAHRAARARPKKMFSIVPGLQLVELAPDVRAEDAIKQYEAMPGVRYAEVNQVYQLAVSPNDPNFSQQWGLHNTGQTGGTADADIDALEAWGHTTGSSSVVVAVVDTGVDYRHPDLAANMWTNSDEIPGNGMDDDGNLWIDDVHGMDVANNDGDPLDDNGHGTHVAGTIGASSHNGTGVVGVNWNVQIMALKAFDATGSSAGDVLSAWQYAIANGATIINNSWGGGGSQAMYDAIAANPALFVCAAGNGGLDGIGDNNDGTSPFYPASYDLPNILSVGASDSKDLPASFSNYGATTVDVFAPGAGILSTYLPSAGGIAPGATVNVLMREDFTAPADWEQYGFGTRPYEPYWTLMTGSYTSPPYSAGITGYVDNQMTGLLKKTGVSLATADHPGMRFHARVDTELGFDYLTSGMYDSLWRVRGWVTGDSQGQFVEQFIDLGEFSGASSVRPFFRLEANGSNSSAQGYEGVWIDDVEVFDVDPGPSGQSWTYDYTNAYALMNGTSMAAPHVTGLAALLLAENPSRNAAALKAEILDSVDVLGSLSGKCVTGGRINAHKALNDQPTASADTYSATSGQKLSVPALGLLANDSDPEGDMLRAVNPTLPGHGTLVSHADGSFEYTSVAGFVGTDTFTYRAKDAADELSLPAVVTINVAAAPPTPPTPPTPQPVDIYRFYNAKNGTHFFTSDPNEKAQIQAKLWATYNYEGVSYSLNPANNSAQLYRFYNRISQSHFYTASDGEAADVIANLSHVFQLDGRAYWVNPSQVANSIPVHRFYNRRNGSHFYTADSDEKADVQARLWQVYQYEGIAFWLGQ